MIRKVFASMLVILSFCSVLAGCNEKSEKPSAPETTAPSEEPAKKAKKSSELEKYLDSFYKGDSDLYGAWRVKGSNLITYVLRNDGLAELAIGGEGDLAQLGIDEKKQTITTQLVFGINGTYSYDLRKDGSLVLSSDDDSMTLERAADFTLVPDPPKDPETDSKLLGWWKSEDGLICFFDKNGTMYTNAISIETCYTYSAKNGKIKAVYDYQGDMKLDFEYSFKKDKLIFDGTEYSRFTPEGI